MKAYDTKGRLLEVGDVVIFNFSSTSGMLTEGKVLGFCSIFSHVGIEVEFIDERFGTGRSRKVKASNTYIINKAEVTK